VLLFSQFTKMLDILEDYLLLQVRLLLALMSPLLYVIRIVYI